VRRLRSLIAAILAAGLPAGAVSQAKAGEFIPVTMAQFSTGQWFFDGEDSALGGNLGVQFVPAYKVSERLAFVPTIESNYRGTRSAEELAGGNTLFQDTWENGLGFKAVMNPSDRWTYRARLGARMKWFRETADESWSNGLYDYRTGSLGGEAERKFGRASLAAGYDFSMIQFPNYDSLESSQSADLARELAGDNVLDATIHLFSLRGHASLPGRIAADLSAYMAPRLYSDQHVVALSGLFTSTKRQDTTTGANLAFERGFRGPFSSMLSASLMYGYLAMQSNQNHYDARLTTFVPDFFDYDQQSVGAQFRAGFGQTGAGPMSLDVGGSYSHRNYASRPIQDEEGLYLSEKLHVIETAVTVGFSYPLTRTFRARVTSTVGRSRSNNRFEELYRYNYSNANYQFGFVYEY
jgi:hypothetical protein